jgi:hypothetical protein
VINDVVDQLALGLTKVLDQPDVVASIVKANNNVNAKSDAVLRADLKAYVHKAVNVRVLPTDAKSDAAGALWIVPQLEVQSRDYLGNMGLVVDALGQPQILFDQSAECVRGAVEQHHRSVASAALAGISLSLFLPRAEYSRSIAAIGADQPELLDVPSPAERSPLSARIHFRRDRQGSSVRQPAR